MATDLRLKEGLHEITDAIVATYLECKHINHLGHRPLPNRDAVIEILADLVEILFPGFARRQNLHMGNVEYHVGDLVDGLHDKLTVQIARAMRHDYDPQAKSHHEIIFCYPGLEAVSVYRIAHELLLLGVPLIPRMMTEHAHSKTGIDIHPGARIGPSFFIDHGTGVVIGETCDLGKHVKLYQGVTLGALSFPRDANGNIIRGMKRHPTLEDEVVVYANATILGGDTVIGRGSVVGSSVWLTHGVPPYTVVSLEKPSLRIKSPDAQDWAPTYDI